jgi:hypothetical protein
MAVHFTTSPPPHQLSHHGNHHHHRTTLSLHTSHFTTNPYTHLSNLQQKNHRTTITSNQIPNHHGLISTKTVPFTITTTTQISNQNTHHHTVPLEPVTFSASPPQPTIILTCFTPPEPP